MRADGAAADLRACPPEETFEKVSPYLSRLGITRVASQTGLDRIGVPVWCAYTPNARSIVIAQGKGINDAAARTSAVMEAVERAVAGDPACATVRSTMAELTATGETADGLDELISVHAAPLKPDEDYQWARGRDLIGHTPVWLPFEAIRFDRTVPAPRFWLSSDGLASGNTPTEATLHGLLERVERDALTLWQITSVAGRHAQRLFVDPGEYAELEDVMDRVSAAGLELALFDITTDLRVPCVAAWLGPSRSGLTSAVRHVDITLGAGASPFPEIAALRAATEAVQSRMTFIGGARDDLVPATFTAPALAQTLAAFEAPLTRSLSQMPRLSCQSAEQALSQLVDHLRAFGMTRLYAIDLSPPWLPVYVVKVVAPLLEHPDGNRRQRLGARALARMLQ